MENLGELQNLAINNMMERIYDAENKTREVRAGELNSLHIAASMDIEKTTESLNQILEYKKEASKQMLQCSDEKKMDIIAGVIAQADDMIRKVLGLDYK